MRLLYIVLAVIMGLTASLSAQSGELTLEWDPAYNTVRGTVELWGSADIPGQQWFFVEAAPYIAGADAAWTPIVSFQMAPVVDGWLGRWDTSILNDGFYQVRLHAVNSEQESFYYLLAPIAVNNDGGIVNPEPVRVVGGQAASIAFIEDRLPLPVGGHVHSFDDAAHAAMSTAGMTWVKKQVQFGISDGKELIEAAHAKGYKVLLGAKGDKNALGADFEGYIADFAEYVAYLAGLGADAIEVWNEPNIDREWPRGRINGAQYTRMLEAAYKAIKAVNPATMVISGAPAPTGFFGDSCGFGGCDDNVFMSQMANAGAANYADCIGAHYNEGILPPNAQGGDPRQPHATRYLLPMLRRVDWAFRNVDIPMCMTEIGYLSPEGYGPLPRGFAWASTTSVSEQAAWLADALLIMSNFEDMPVELAIIWNIDFETYDADPQAGYAIIRRDGSCPACETIAQLQR